MARCVAARHRGASRLADAAFDRDMPMPSSLPHRALSSLAATLRIIIASTFFWTGVLSRRIIPPPLGKTPEPPHTWRSKVGSICIIYKRYETDKLCAQRHQPACNLRISNMHAQQHSKNHQPASRTCTKWSRRRPQPITAAAATHSSRWQAYRVEQLQLESWPAHNHASGEVQDHGTDTVATANSGLAVAAWAAP
eukprot:365961-Chlamydomonas_euryale.AAC.5